MAARAIQFLTPEQYLEIECQAEYKSEYFSGEMFAMAGASPEHSVIAWNIGSELRVHLKDRPCTAHLSDLRVQAGRGTAFTYPDVVVRCGEARYRPPNPVTLLNPSVIIEVLSQSTKSVDEVIKFRYYREIESLSDYVLVDQETMQVDHYTRQPDGDWLLHISQGPKDSLVLASIDCRLPLSEIYDKVEFPPESTRLAWAMPDEE